MKQRRVERNDLLWLICRIFMGMVRYVLHTIYTKSWVNVSDLHQSCHSSYHIITSLCLFYEFTNCCRLATNILFVTQLHDGWVNLHNIYIECSCESDSD